MWRASQDQQQPEQRQEPTPAVREAQKVCANNVTGQASVAPQTCLLDTGNKGTGAPLTKLAYRSPFNQAAIPWRAFIM